MSGRVTSPICWQGRIWHVIVIQADPRTAARRWAV